MNLHPIGSCYSLEGSQQVARVHLDSVMVVLRFERRGIKGDFQRSMIAAGLHAYAAFGTGNCKAW